MSDLVQWWRGLTEDTRETTRFVMGTVAVIVGVLLFLGTVIPIVLHYLIRWGNYWETGP